MALKNIPQAERLLSGTLTSYLSDVATTCVMSDPPSKFPTYIDLEPDSTTKKELIRAVAVSGSTVTIERSVNGVVTDHAANATYKQKITSRHWDAVSDALEKGLLMEDALRVLIRVSDTQFTITGYGASDDLTGTYTIGRVLRINSSASYVMTVTSSSYSAGTNKTTIDVSATLPTPVSTVEFGIAPLGGTNLPLTSPTLTTPKITTSINDANGNEVIKTPATPSAVNEVTITNSATGNAVQVSATGGDTNIDLKLVAKGTGGISDKNGDYLSPNYSMARQAIINGNFDVWQRGTTFATCPGVTYYADRWAAYDGGGASETKISRQDGTGVYGSYYCARFGRVVSSTSITGCFLGQPLESLDSIKFRSKKLTLSFWARKGANFSATSDLLVGEIMSGTATDGPITNPSTSIASVNCTLTTSWQKFTCTTTNVVADTVTQLAVRIKYTGTGTAGAADYFEITQVQLCAGDVALPFQPKSFEEELRACMRYCWVPESAQGTSTFGLGFAYSTTMAFIPIKLPVQMRTIPTLTATAGDFALGDIGTTIDVTAINNTDDAVRQTKDSVVIRATVASGLTQWRSYFLQSDANANRIMVFSAEL